MVQTRQTLRANLWWVFYFLPNFTCESSISPLPVRATTFIAIPNFEAFVLEKNMQFVQVQDDSLNSLK